MKKFFKKILFLMYHIKEKWEIKNRDIRKNSQAE